MIEIDKELLEKCYVYLTLFDTLNLNTVVPKDKLKSCIDELDKLLDK